jgi:hypothetical protein
MTEAAWASVPWRLAVVLGVPARSEQLVHDDAGPQRCDGRRNQGAHPRWLLARQPASRRFRGDTGQELAPLSAGENVTTGSA